MNVKTFSNQSDLALSLYFVGSLVVGYLIYSPALTGPFLLDDFDNLGALQGGVNNLESLINYLTTGQAGPLGRPISKLSFLINDNAWPSSPESFKYTNLLIHLLNGILTFLIIRVLIRVDGRNDSDYFALLIALLFIFHPLQMSTVMYVVQRMTQLATLFTLLGVWVHVYLRYKWRNIPLTISHFLLLTSNLTLFTLLAAFSKENGILLPMFVLVIEKTIFSNDVNTYIYVWWRRACLMLPSALIVSYIAYWPRWKGSYGNRDFTLIERLYTEPVVLIDYLTSIFSMRVGGLGLFQDDYPIYSSLTELKVFSSIFVISALLTAAICIRKRYPLVAFGIFWYFAGHILESTTISLELYFEHRNYTPIVGAVTALVFALKAIFEKVSESMLKLSTVIYVFILIIAGASTWGYAKEWSSPNRLIPIWAVEHIDSPRAQRTYAQLLAEMGLPGAAMDTLDDAYKRFPYDLSIPLMSIDIYCALGGKQRYNFDKLAKRVEDHKVTDALRPVLENLFGRILTSDCMGQVNELHALVKELPKLQKGEKFKSAMASYFVLDGDLHLKQGKGNEALDSYRMVEQLIPSADSALRLAGFFMLVKDYTNAKASLNMAYSRDLKKNWGMSQRKKNQYAEKFALIEKLRSS